MAGLCSLPCYIWHPNLNSDCFNLLLLYIYIYVTPLLRVTCIQIYMEPNCTEAKVGHFPFTLFQNETILLILFCVAKQEMRYCCSTWSKTSPDMFCRIVVAMCHIFPITCSSWEILSHIQAHILFLLLVSDGAFQPESKGRSHKHNVSKTQTQNLCQEHFLLNHIRLNVIWNNGCKTMKECTPMIPDYILPCFFLIFLFFYYWECL